jgi:quinoprotein glucose dehydrogenase
MRRFLIPILVLAMASFTFAANPQPYKPFVAPASDEGEMAVAQITVPKGFKANLFAAEPRLANPVSFYIDEHNRFWVVETFRRKSAVIDIRNQMHWLDDDTASRTVAMRIAMVKKFFDAPTVEAMKNESERIKLIEDRDGDGKADFDTVFADGFNRLEDGIAAGVLVRGDDVYFTNIPSLWRLRDTNHDKVADVRQELHYGYGVRYNFNGHDLHGLRFGPDGKLYFSIGDRGAHVEKTPDGRVVSNPDTGSVFRCNADGTELEIFATGLRNPQELAFDEYGNLFTGDNNSDAGDAARWVYVVEGGDTGWREGYQSQEWPVSRGPWNLEGIWKTKPEYPALYIVPPVAELKASGPAGLTHDPGTGMPEEFKGRFFLADFRGGPANSSVHAIKVVPKGAGFEVVEQERIIGNVLCTDVEIGYDGLYISDWTNGWLTTGKGRIYRIQHEQAIKDPLVAQTRKLMDEGMAKRPIEELVALLGHTDQRVRQAAQFELAGRGGYEGAALLVKALKSSDNRLVRLHSLWALSQFARTTANDPYQLGEFLSDKDDEVRAQAMKLAGNERKVKLAAGVVKGMSDPSPRVRFFAAIAAGKIKRPIDPQSVIAMIRENDDRDPYLRHAGVMALVGLKDISAIRAAADDPAKSVRLAALLAMRRMHDAEVAKFLDDQDPQLVLEAARAINDEPIEQGMPRLATLLGREGMSDPVALRALNANYRAGTPEAAAALAKFANTKSAREEYRSEALRMLGEWASVPGRDRVTGTWRPLEPRDIHIARDAAAPVLPEILRTAPDSVRVMAAGLVTKLGVGEPALLAELAGDTKLKPELRAAALAALAASGDLAKLSPAVESAMKESSVQLRAAAVRAMGSLPDPVKRLTQIINSDSSTREKQAAISTLAPLPGEEVDGLIAGLLERMSGQKGVAPEIQLDILEAAAARKGAGVAEKLKQYESKRNPSDPLAPYRETLVGGDAAAGEKIFRERIDVSCIRCHSIKKKGGNAGPDLAGIALKHDRAYLLESIIQPSKVIAPGFETVAVRTKDGKMYAGQVKFEDDKILQIIDPGKSDVRVEKAKIKARRGGMSSMPDNIAMTLSKQDVRNLVEFLAGLKQEPREKKKKDPDAHGERLQ